MIDLNKIDNKPVRKVARLAQCSKANRKMRRYYASLSTQNAVARSRRVE
jgi:hypothetical protein